MILRTGFLSLLSVGVLCAQTFLPPNDKTQAITADSLVDQLVENAAVYRATLPSLTAHETILSHDSSGWLRSSHHAEAEATMRVMRKTDGPLEESREITILDGRPVAADKHAVLPTALKGGFGGMPTVFFGRENRYCFNFVLAPHAAPDAPYKLLIAVRPEAASRPHCPIKELATMTAIALVAVDAHQLTHLEWTFPTEIAVKYHRWPFASVDLAPAKLGSETFWLPTAVIGRGGTVKDQNEWVSHYSNYQRYTATSTILSTDPDR